MRLKKILDPVISVSSIYTLYDLNLKKDYMFYGETHHFYEINIVLSGSVGLTIDDKLFELKKGQAFIIKPDCFHKNWVIGQEEARLFVITFDIQTFSVSIPDNAVYSISNSDLPYVGRILQEGLPWINSEAKSTPLATPHMLKNLIECLIISMLRQSHEASVFTSTSGDIFYRAVHFMNSNIKENITIDQIARYSNTSVANLKKVFKKFTGNGAIHHFNALKLEYSKELLKSEIPICEVAVLLSFSSQNHYAQSFKKAFGITPSKFKASIN
ncbi:MAG: helix-turn-helix transcriptional regulator [Clostridia bacterium]|nr:helix-turn-helix transcriptional regulator [Clostridia bacterium]